MKSVAALTIESVIEASRCGSGHAARRAVTDRRTSRRACTLDRPMQRLADPVRRRRWNSPPTRLLSRPRLRACLPAALPRRPGRHPGPLLDDAAGSVAFVAIGKALVFELLGLHQQWWRYFRLPDLWPLFRAAAVASALLVAVFVLAKPYAVQPAALGDRLRLHAHARPARRRPARAAHDRRAPDRARARAARRGVLVVGAGSGGQMVVRELQLNPNLGARAIGFLDDDPRKRGMHAAGSRCSARPTRSARSSTALRPTRS